MFAPAVVLEKMTTPSINVGSGPTGTDRIDFNTFGVKIEFVLKSVYIDIILIMGLAGQGAK